MPWGETMTEHSKPRELAALETLLDTFGSDADRWPEAERAPMLALIERSAAARQLVTEARALDRVLSHGDVGVSEPERNALADRILAAALAERGKPALRPVAAADPVTQTRQPAEGVVVAWPGARKPAAASAAPATSVPRRISGSWRMGALMAASLAAGLLIGSFEATPALIGSLADGFGQSEAVRTLAALQGDGLSILLEEDLL